MYASQIQLELYPGRVVIFDKFRSLFSKGAAPTAPNRPSFADWGSPVWPINTFNHVGRANSQGVRVMAQLDLEGRCPVSPQGAGGVSAEPLQRPVPGCGGPYSNLGPPT